MEVEDLPAMIERLKQQGATFRNELVQGKGSRQLATLVCEQ